MLCTLYVTSLILLHDITENTLKSMGKHHMLPIYVKKMATENGGLLVCVFCTFYNYFTKVLSGINVKNRFVYVSNIWDKMDKTFP